jgi:hypothetical protein
MTPTPAPVCAVGGWCAGAVAWREAWTEWLCEHHAAVLAGWDTGKERRG